MNGGKTGAADRRGGWAPVLHSLQIFMTKATGPFKFTDNVYPGGIGSLWSVADELMIASGRQLGSWRGRRWAELAQLVSISPHCLLASRDKLGARRLLDSEVPGKAHEMDR